MPDPGGTARIAAGRRLGSPEPGDLRQAAPPANQGSVNDTLVVAPDQPHPAAAVRPSRNGSSVAQW